MNCLVSLFWHFHFHWPILQTLVPRVSCRWGTSLHFQGWRRPSCNNWELHPFNRCKESRTAQKMQFNLTLQVTQVCEKKNKLYLAFSIHSVSISDLTLSCTRHELANSGAQWKELVTSLRSWRCAACCLKLLIEQLTVAAPSCSITPCNISHESIYHWPLCRLVDAFLMDSSSTKLWTKKKTPYREYFTQ